MHEDQGSGLGGAKDEFFAFASAADHSTGIGRDVGGDVSLFEDIGLKTFGIFIDPALDEDRDRPLNDPSADAVRVELTSGFDIDGLIVDSGPGGFQFAFVSGGQSQDDEI